MRHTVSKWIPNCSAGHSSPPRLSYRSEDTPSGWYSFPVNISQYVAVIPNHFSISVVPHLFCCRPASPPPQFQSLLSHISTTVTFWHCLHHWSCLPSPLYRSNDMPSGWKLFPVDISPVRRRPYKTFCYLRIPTYHLLLSHISSAAISTPVVLHLRHRDRPPLYSPLNLSAIPTSRFSVAVLI